MTSRRVNGKPSSDDGSRELTAQLDRLSKLFSGESGDDNQDQE